MKRILSILILGFVFLAPTHPIYADTIKPIRILIVPGHDNKVWGAQYGKIKEADMNLRLAKELFSILNKDKRFEVFITRNSENYTKEFADYFLNNRSSVITFEKNAKKEQQASVLTGDFIIKEGAPHNGVKSDIALRLYSFNKWANENNIDAMIHIHFNDYPRKHSRTIGKYTGFTVYMPDAQRPNGPESIKLAQSIFTQLKQKYTPSTFPKENGGLISDQKLIALGANGTLNASVLSVLNEYGYIYEKKFRYSKTRHQAYKDMATLTVNGIKDYFFVK